MTSRTSRAARRTRASGGRPRGGRAPVIVDGRAGLAAVGSFRPGPMAPTPRPHQPLCRTDRRRRGGWIPRYRTGSSWARHRSIRSHYRCSRASPRSLGLVRSRQLSAAAGNGPFVVIAARFPPMGRALLRLNRSCAAWMCIRRGGCNLICRSASCISIRSAILTRSSLW